MQITTFEKALEYIFSYIPNSKDFKFEGQLCLDRAKHFLNLLDNPQEKLHVVHIAGTSGKGSTSYLTSSALISQGFKTGLSLSPHVIDIRERIQVNNKLISKDKFLRYLNEIIPFAESMRNSKYGFVSYFELIIGLAYYIFYKESVDYAIMETGLGGRFDATNVVENTNKVVILTKIGHDHINILGKTLHEIAQEKAGIIQKMNMVFSSDQNYSVKKVFDKKVSYSNGLITYIKPNIHFNNISCSETKTIFNFSYSNLRLEDIKLGLSGSFQAENCSMALAVLSFLSKRDKFTIDEQKLRNVLDNANFIGRLEIKRYKDKTIIIDGAHNPQKMKTFLYSLYSIFPNKKFSFLIAFKEGKDAAKMLKCIIPSAKYIYFTSFIANSQEMRHQSIEPTVLGQICKNQNYYNYKIINNLKDALEELLKNEENNIVITGSLYLIGEIYKLELI